MIPGFLRGTAALAATALILAACSGGGGGGGSTGGGVPVVPTTSPPPPGQSTAYSCPSSAAAFGVSSSGASTTSAVHRMVRTHAPALVPHTVLAVTYADGRRPELVDVDRGDLATARAQLRAKPGVESVAVAQKRYALTRTATLTNDPYFEGAKGTSAPLYQTASTGGQWDMHIIGLEHAFSYSLGSSAVKLAIIDTGEDVTQPDLAAAHIVHTQCFITDASGKVQSVGRYVTDPDGHGTDVAGIAGAAINNGFGFAGAGGAISLMLYRVFPTPSDSCSNPGSTDAQCSAWDIDIASAINDAVANGANVISLSLGDDSGNCTNGVDPDSIEGNAVSNALAHNVIVVAASGNAGKTNVGPPGCATGVIAVGASAYNDGLANGSGYSGSRKEYVASYSNWGSINSAKSASSWGIVAPGGDPTGGSDSDNLHWIENIWTSTPLDSSFAGACGTDPYGGANDCRIEIAGTSMSTPHVAGAAALVLSINGSYASPSKMKQLLCSTADDIGDPHEGCGRLNLYRAAAVAAGDPVLP